MTLMRTLPLAAALLLTAGAAVADDATDAQVRKVEVHKFMVAGEDADVPKTGVFVKRIQTNGGEPNTVLQVLGGDAEAIDLEDILDGETRSFEIGDGKWMDVTRDGDTLQLDIDGKEIEIPLNPAVNSFLPGLPGLTGSCDKQMKFVMLSGDELHDHHDGHHEMIFMGHDGVVQHLDADADLQWTEDGTVSPGVLSKVLVKTVGADGEELTEDVRVMAMPAFSMHGLVGHQPDFASLDALKDADPEVREKVIAALKEILGQQHGVTLDVDVDHDGDQPAVRKVRVRRAAPSEVH